MRRLPDHSAAGAVGGAASGYGSGRGAAAGGAAGTVVGGVFSIFASEMHDMERTPPDLKAYSACLTGRGYDVSWPKGQEP